jgi:hypothetical protein
LGGDDRGRLIAGRLQQLGVTVCLDRLTRLAERESAGGRALDGIEPLEFTGR